MAPMTSGGLMRAMRHSRLPRWGQCSISCQAIVSRTRVSGRGAAHPCKAPPRPSGPDVRAGGVPAAAGRRGAAVSLDPPSAGTAGTAGANIDEDEVAKFSALASRWWDPDGEFRPLHRLNPIRTDYVASRVDLAGARVADIGCGGGLLCESLAARGAAVLGIDASADNPRRPPARTWRSRAFTSTIAR